MEKNKLIDLFKSLEEKAYSSNFYSDFNYFFKIETRTVIDNSQTDISKTRDEGIKIRIFDGEKFLEAATSNINKEEIENIFEDTLQLAKKNKEYIKDKIELKIDKNKLEKDFQVKFNPNKYLKYNLEDKVNFLKSFKEKILSASEKIVNARVILVEGNEAHYFVNHYKSLSQNLPKFIFAYIAFVKSDDGQIRTLYESNVSNSLNVFEKGEKNLNKFIKKIEKVSKAKKLKGGKYKAILSPKLSGLLAHESFGHGMEADTMLKDRALASKYIGKKIGTDNINIIDYPNIEGKHGYFFFDHEGNIAKKTYLVKNGVINEPMADIYSKTYLNLENSSNSRFESFDHKNYTRMSNTYFEPGKSIFDDMIKKVDDGILILDSSGGMEDPYGWGVQIQGNFGQRIKNGKLIDEYYDGFALTGFLPDLIKNISDISKEFEMEGGGHCGKGHKEWVRVAEGGPYLLINEVILG